MDLALNSWTLLGWQFLNFALIAGLLYLGYKLVKRVFSKKIEDKS